MTSHMILGKSGLIAKFAQIYIPRMRKQKHREDPLDTIGQTHNQIEITDNIAELLSKVDQHTNYNS